MVEYDKWKVTGQQRRMGIFLSLIHVKTEQIQHEDIIPILQEAAETLMP
jgi:hypothetical protein